MKLLKKNKEKKSEAEQVEERREEVLAKGRKFKYPLQWTRHRVVINTILVATVVITLLFIGGWLALYRFGKTDDFLFKITEIIPAPVASVDSEKVRFSDYLMFYRSSITSIERQSSVEVDEESRESLLSEYKRIALNEAEKYAYAQKLARELELTVDESEIDSEFNRHRQVGGIDRSEEAFVKIIEDNFGLSKSEYRRMLYLALIKSKVEIAINESANSIATEVEKRLAGSNNDYQATAQALGDKVIYEETGGLVDSRNVDGGRASEAIKLEPEQSTGKFVSMNGDGYYFVKLIKKTDTEVNFVSIKVPFTEFDTRFTALRDEDKIKEYIEIKVPSTVEGSADESIPEPTE